MKTVRYRFERELERVVDNSEAKSWLKSEFQSILESDKEFTRKTDYIGFSLLSIDNKVQSIDEEIKELQELKRGLKEAKTIALEIGAEVLSEYGIDRLEGMGVSSITLTDGAVSAKPLLKILDQEKLINAGYCKTVVDEEAVLAALYGADERERLKDLCEVDLVVTQKPPKLKVNKRRSKKAAFQELEVAS
ncbi:MAG TPA: hypothetical protein ENK74_00070 [Nitratifractor sp.]|nr:hypothetical protein [Nitratifractor sp.]